ncbi:MAG TPA: VPDSG-CTERM sorting domain-containing protein [Opitutaceae bacterium]|nr:VPDSG-CTERM sorting domain-containing protein [Opitutaceae bacterium]
MKKLLSIAGALVALAFANIASAASIQGSIGFTGVPVFNSTPISGATGISAYTFAYVAPGTNSGDYASVTTIPLQLVTFSPFSFSDASISPLWTFTAAGVTYSFTATSVTASFDAVLNIWNVGGLGVASITGKTDTVGSWNFSAGNQGAAFTFLSNATVPATVPDSGTTALLLGLGLTVVGFVARRKNA